MPDSNYAISIYQAAKFAPMLICHKSAVKLFDKITCKQWFHLLFELSQAWKLHKTQLQCQEGQKSGLSFHFWYQM